MPQYSLSELADLLDAKLVGDGAITISSVAPVATAKNSDICYVKSSKYADLAAESSAGAILLCSELAEQMPAKHNLLLVDNVELAFVRMANLFIAKPALSAGIAKSAVVAETAQVDPTAAIAANVVIGDNCVIGAGVVINPGCVLYSDVHIAEQTTLHSNVVLYSAVKLGSKCIIHSGSIVGSDGFGNVRDAGKWLKVPQLGTVIIHNDVEIGANVTIDRGALEDTIIHDGVRIDNQVHLGHNVTVGQSTAIAGGAVVAGSVKIGANCLIGGGCCISGHLELADGVILTGMSAVSKSVVVPGVYSSGQPVQTNRDWHRSVVHYRNLDKIVKRIQKLEKQRHE